MATIADALLRVMTDTGFSGIVRVEDGAGTIELVDGLADRRSRTPHTATTRFGIASGTKGVTAATVLSLVAAGELDLDGRVRPLIGDALPLIDDRVTVEHLLAHRSGIGDYLDESTLGDITDYVLSVPVHRLDETDGYVPLLDGRPQVGEPGTTFSYNNSGYVLLALLVERATGRPFREVVAGQVLDPAGMAATAFLRSDELPGDAAIGYLGEGDRTNVLHLPVRGSGDGGLYTTVADIHRFWSALAGGRILPPELVARMTGRASVTGARAYGLGVWLSPTDSWWELEGSDAGVSFQTRFDPATGAAWTVVSNTSAGAWPIVALLDERDALRS